MKQTMIITSLLLSVFSIQTLKAQVPDSMALAKQQVQITKLETDLSERKMKLAKTENSLKLATERHSEAEEKAARSAADNAKLADKLRNDPTDKRLSRKARKSARSAERYAKKARKAKSSMEGLSDDAEKYRKRIATDEKKLADMKLTTNNPQ